MNRKNQRNDMSVKANLKYLRTSPRKVRLVADLIRGRSVEDADKILMFIVKKSSDPLVKLLRSAVSNAEHNFGLERKNLYVAEIKVDGGPTLKRFMPRARGSVSPIHKKTSHISLVLKERGEEQNKRKERKSKIKKTYQEERPKEDSVRLSGRRKSDEKQKESKISSGAVSGGVSKKKMFRRKSI